MVDELHPTGRCTCAGEGLCDWCLASRLRDPEAWGLQLRTATDGGASFDAGGSDYEYTPSLGANVVRLDDYRPNPHLVMACNDGHQHVFPVAWVRDIVEGKPVEPLEPCMLRTILGEWLEDVESA